MKQIELYNAVPALRKLAAAEGLPARQLYALLRLTRDAQRETSLFQDATLRVYRECGTADGEGYRVTPGREAELAERLREIGEAEVEGVAPIAIDYQDSMRLSVNDIELLEGIVMLREEEDTDAERN